LAASSYLFFGLRDDVPVLLITGGSSGAKRLNDAIVRRVPEIIAQGWQVLHVVGPTLPAPEDTPRGYVAVDYCRRMDWAYSVADVVIARAGAATVSELAIAGLPSVLVPYHVGNGEQQKNARYLVDAGAALTVSQEKFDDAYIDTVVMGLLRDKSARDEMSQAAKSVAIVDAAAQVAAMVWSAGLGASADVDAP
jgi:UDP-N-acetylglucosamine--N-acetylmuramyl-(pentapeptide) pyrophosphoryl-undecaprenol N-acetylglucosamine transferase